MKKKKSSTIPKSHLKTIFSIVLLGLLLVVLLPRLNNLTFSINAIKTAEAGFVLLAVVPQIMSYVWAALAYIVLSKNPLPFGDTLLLQGSTGFANRLLPVGLGGLGLNAYFLIKHHYTGAQASTIVLLNNIIGFWGNIALLGLFLIVDRSLHVKFDNIFRITLIAFVMIVIIIVLSRIIVPLRLRLARTMREVSSVFDSYRKSPLRLFNALFLAMLTALSYSLVLFFSVRSVGAHISLGQALVVMSAGSAAGLVTPTPGGLVGVEAGLTASMVVFGVSQPLALAAALIYRLITYWLPVVPGFICFKLAQSRKII